MSLIVNAILVTFEMMGIFFGAFIAVFLLALLLSPIENRVSSLVWKHSSHEAEAKVVASKPSFRAFSRKYR